MDASVNASRETMARVRRVFVDSLELNLEGESADAARLDELVGFDSAAAIVFVAALEKEFAITFEAEKLNLDFLGDAGKIAAYLDERRRG